MSESNKLAAFFGATGVALGAFGAHGLNAVLESNQTVDVWHTASLYHLLHAVALLIPTRANATSRILFSSGILIFSGSLYIFAVTGIRWLGAITPIGGVALIAGWIATGFRGKQHATPADSI